MATCYVWQGYVGSTFYAFALCVSSGTPGWIIGSSYPSGQYKLPAVNGALASGATDFYVTPGNIIACPTQSQYNSAVAGRALRGNCNSCITTSTLYDCVNGQCFSSDKYNTPGLYQALSDCESTCGVGCSGKCISNADWSQIEGLSNQLKQRNCS
ncbi:MAG: hypothetical protein KME52_04850 [Desmonostoc geniculatum HA4340-LM1]|jgi:hypothetical protein|nr:hypothetical protein [Desmonostoc geniculatum HA4340-LM1]